MTGRRAPVRYEDIMRDARNETLTESTRLHAALDAIYACRPPAGLLVETLGTLGVNEADKALLGRLRDWVMHIAPMGPLPMSPSEAVALAERVHKVMGAT